MVEEILERSLKRRSPDGPSDIDNDFVLAMTGYQPDFGLLGSMGITLADDAWRTPVYYARTFETARPGIHLAGTVFGGLRANRWFIEKGRFLARQIARHLAGLRTDTIPFAETHWNTEEAPSPVEIPCVPNC